ncbi:hypothetical protein F0P96_17240 [Hymenobacter busanensis]|uniref:Uncharacterized protein n=1 Tax=Hymenobacter busanensis TaxID=2607656 RepID=A0A7L4ZWY4_9BACT|nr:hypothetical protein [Hymenobacter busanensis]KAA9327720.1 hypothetical protein F0P96_17240 [Hymenobacter busanensis]QHJ05940.1 hypothetical protein GUY19_00985 [Hymenobacter busanensis]
MLLLTLVGCDKETPAPTPTPAPTTQTGSLTGRLAPAGSASLVLYGLGTTYTPLPDPVTGVLTLPELPVGSYSLVITPKRGYSAVLKSLPVLIAAGQRPLRPIAW